MQSNRNAIGQIGGWNDVPWTYVERSVRKVQEKIFQATQRQEWRKVRNLQKLLVRSSKVLLLAIRRVTQENAGKYTPGVDGKVYVTDDDRWTLFKTGNFEIGSRYKPLPGKRVYIPKNKQEPQGAQRPLGILAMHDRILQTVVKMCIDPEWEARFEQNSYGFRPGRCTMDAIEQIHKTLCRVKTAFILDADISKCFDNIAHGPLLEKIPGFRSVVGKWLRAGVVGLGTFKDVLTGTPQGGTISPLLANIALDGLERLFGCINSKGRYVQPAERAGMNKGISVIRYADDFVIIAPSKEIIVAYVIPRLETFLAARGLNLNKAKTRIVDIDQGFNFLGFTIRRIDGKILTIPQAEKVRDFLRHVQELLHENRQVTTESLLRVLNPVIKGWTNYFKHASASQTFSKVANELWWKLWRWSCRRHRMKPKRWIHAKYFHKVGNCKSVFGVDGTFAIARPELIKIVYFTKVRGASSPYDPTLREYWRGRSKKYAALFPADA